MFRFRHISKNLSTQIKRQISTSKPINTLKFTGIRYAPALNLSLIRNASIADSYAKNDKITDDTEKPKNNDIWANMDKYSEEERERLLEDSTQQHRQKNTARTNKYGIPAFLAFMFFSGVAWWGYYDVTDEQEKESEFWRVDSRTKLALYNFLAMLDDLFTGSEEDQLLPPRQKPPPGYISLEPNYVLVIEPIRCLLVPEYDLKNGWRMRKRAGFERFNSAMKWDRATQQHNDYELVAWTSKPLMEFQETTASLRVLGFEATPLFREACQYIPNLKSWGENGNMMPKPYYKKPIGRLNRDLKKLIIVDYDKRAFEDYPENGLVLPLAPEDPHENDLVLHDLTTFLMHIVNDQVEDVRPIIKYYSQFGDKWLDKFRENSQAPLEEEISASEEDIMRERMQHFSKKSWFKR